MLTVFLERTFKLNSQDFDGFYSQCFCMGVCGETLPMQHLDISDDKQFTSDVARQLLGQPGILPALVSLDVSGRKQVRVVVFVCLSVSV